MTNAGLRLARNLIDISMLSFAYWAAYFLRWEGVPPDDRFRQLLVTWPIVVAAQFLLLALMGVPKHSWRYVSLREVVRIFVALAIPAAVLLSLRVGFGSALLRAGWDATVIPASITVADFCLAFFLVAGVRATRRLTSERARTRGFPADGEPQRTLLIGAGQAGLMVAREIAARPDLGMRAVGFVDDDRRKVGQQVYGVPILGTTEHLAALCARTGGTQALITIAAAPGSTIRRIVSQCEDAGVETKIIPSVYEIVGGKVNLRQIRPIAIEDLLRRDPVELELDGVSGLLSGKTVLVTGAGGSIGGELCRQIIRFAPRRLVLLDRSEPGLFAIQQEVLHHYPEDELLPVIADVTDARRLAAVFRRHRPEIVFHAAAHKHVPLLETNPGEAVKNNAIGTRILADAAHEHGVAAFVLISTDKEVNPVSVMGASKRAACRYVEALNKDSDTRFITVRFGNVLDSSGSVVPSFRRQIEHGGPVTITHPDMTRYFMTIPEAARLVLQAASMGQGGEVFILDMGEPVGIVELANDMIRLSGLRPGKDIEIAFTGIRSGEKLAEELSFGEEEADRTEHPKVLVARGNGFATVDELASELDSLRAICDEAGPEVIRAALSRIVPEYRPAGASGAYPEMNGAAHPPHPSSAGVSAPATTA